MNGITRCNLIALASVFVLAGVGHAANVQASSNGKTLYVYDNDKRGISECNDACATKWPPYKVVKGQKMGAGWTTVTRKDGTLQWAYNGQPVYFYSLDIKKGDSKGDGKGGIWHAIKG